MELVFLIWAKSGLLLSFSKPLSYDDCFLIWAKPGFLLSFFNTITNIVENLTKKA